MGAYGHKRSASAASNRSGRDGHRQSGDFGARTVTLYREDQRVSLRAFLRTLLQNQQIADSKAMEDFFTGPSVVLNEEERQDIERRKEMDAKRIEEQKQFYEIARQRARELDVYMEKFRRDIVESSMYNLSMIASQVNEGRWLVETFCGNQDKRQDRRFVYRI